MRAALLIARVLGSVVALSLAASVLWRTYMIMVVGSYWATATIPATVFVAVVLPALCVAALVASLTLIWKL